MFHMKQPAQSLRAKIEMLAGLYGWTVSCYGPTGIVHLYREVDGMRRTMTLYSLAADEDLIKDLKERST